MKTEGELISALIEELYKRSLLTSWRQFAKGLGVTHQTLGAYRKGTSVPKGEVSNAIAKEANVTIDELTKYREGRVSLKELLDGKRKNPVPLQEVKRSVPYYGYTELTELLIEISNRLGNYRCLTGAREVQSSVGNEQKNRMYSSGESNEYLHLSYKQQRRLRSLLIESAIYKNWTSRQSAESRLIDAYYECEPHYVDNGVDLELLRSIFRAEMNGVHFLLLDALAGQLHRVVSWSGDIPTINSQETYEGKLDSLLHDLENHNHNAIASVV
jgi:transcriptional regulator with XRE-family HTH domain